MFDLLPKPHFHQTKSLSNDTNSSELNPICTIPHALVTLLTYPKRVREHILNSKQPQFKKLTQCANDELPKNANA